MQRMISKVILVVFIAYIMQTTLSIEPILSLPLLIISSVYPMYGKAELIASVLLISYLDQINSPVVQWRIVISYLLILAFLLLRISKSVNTGQKLIDGIIVQVVFLLGLVIYPIRSESIWIAISALIFGLMVVLLVQSAMNYYFRESGEINGR